MKKSTLIVILIIYIGSIAIINFFGMSVKLYDKIINVQAVECINQSDSIAEVIQDTNKKIIKLKFDKSADIDNLQGTMLQLKWHVYPDNATTKDIQFVYDKNNNKVVFYKDESGRETGLMLFSGPTQIYVNIMSTDGTKKNTQILVWVTP